MKRKANKRLFLGALPILAMIMALSSIGCSNNPPRQAIENIDEAFHASSSHIADATGFIDVLKQFDFQKGESLKQALTALDNSAAAADELLSNSNQLEEFDYEAGMADLEQDVSDYSSQVAAAVEELKPLLDNMKGILTSISPFFDTSVSLEMEKSQGERLQELRALETQLDTSKAQLQAAQLTVSLEQARDIILDFFVSARQVIEAMIATPTLGTSANPFSVSNLQKVADSLQRWQQFLQKLSDQLLINRVDPYVEKVELEINNLYLGQNLK
jgi:hypothetical protein